MSQDLADSFDEAFAEFAKTPESAPAPASEVDDDAVVAAPAPTAPAASDDEQPAADPMGEMQRQVDDARHRERSSANRVSAFAKENNQLKSVVDEMRRQLDELMAAKAAPVRTAAPVDDDVLDQAPDLNAAVQKRVSTATAGLESTVAELRKKVEQAQQEAEQANQRLQPIISREDRKQHEEVWNGLDERFTKSWREDIRGADFDGWLQGQRQEIRSIYTNANTVEDSASVLTLYYAAKGKPMGSPAPTPAPAQPANPNTERLRRAAGVAPRGNVRPPTGPAPDDFDGHFAVFSQALKQA